MKEFFAVSSLESAAHATHKDHGRLSVNWFVARRCNRDCSYCAPHLHDNYSRPQGFEHCATFLDTINSLSKPFQINFGGGEPFLDKHMLRVMQHARDKSNCYALGTTSNGTLPLQVYQQAASTLSYLTISIHLEASGEELDHVIEVCEHIHHNYPDLFFTTNIMALPGRFDLVESIRSRFASQGIKHVVRTITPVVDSSLNIVPVNSRLEIIHSDLSEQDLVDIRNRIDRNKSWSISQYYTTEELEYLASHSEPTWNNIRIHHSAQEFTEINTDTVLAHQKNNWQGWICYAGVDSLFVNWDGTVYRGMCRNGGSLGSLDSITAEDLTTPTQCALNWCNCAPDMVVRKCAGKEYLPLITE